MKISLLIANYNNGHRFYDCYKSIISQTSGNWDVWIVDDASTDDSVNTIKSIIKGDIRFHLHCETVNRGVGYTKARAAELATGDAFVILDPDDALVPEALEKLQQGLLQHPEAVMVFSSKFLCDENLVVTGKMKLIGDPHHKKLSYWEKGIASVHYLLAIRREAYFRSGGINKNLRNADDVDIILKLDELGDFYRIEEPLYYYRQNITGSLVSPENAAKSWPWVFQAFSDAGERRVKSGQWQYSYYTKCILEKVIFVLNEVRKAKDHSTFHRVRRMFFANPINRRLFFGLIFWKYFIRHWRSFLYA